MTKEERHRAGYSRITAYSVAEGIRMKHLAAFLKREHAVVPRIFDEAVYAVSSSTVRWEESLTSHRYTICHYYLDMDHM